MLSLLLILSGLGRLTSAGPYPETSFLQITVPRKIEPNSSDGEVSETHVTYAIKIDREIYTFHLEKQSFLDPHFLVYAYNKTGTLYPDSSFIKGHCFYQGYATEVPKSAVTLSTCSGLRGFLQLENVSYGIEPLESSTVYEHMLYQINNDKIDFSLLKENFPMPQLVQKSYKILVKSNKDSDEQLKKILKIQIIMDKALFDYMGSEVAVAAEKVVHIFGLINTMFFQLKVTVKLTSLELWSDQNKISTKGDADDVLQRFVSWKEQFLFQRSHDMAYLLIYRDHPNYVGATYHGMACNPKFAAGIALYPQTITLEAFSVVMTQLLGVSLGLTYNNDAFTCYCPGTACIMNTKAIRSHGVKFFSSCSMDEFKRMVSQPEFECLQNQIVSEVAYRGRSSLCGNGILEPPEQCDCGSKQHCKKFEKCCNPEDCTLTEFAECGTGPCCNKDTCLISVRGTVCRKSRDPCDFTEFCNGRTEFCVPDVRSADLEPCNNKTAYCYQGICQDTDKQCAELFGKFAKGSTFLCTQEVNMHNDDFGNCRRDSCNFRDILCGKIVCHWTRLEVIPFKKFDIQYTYMEGHLCVSAYLRIPTAHVTEDYTYTSDGTMCGPNMYCDQGRCSPISYTQRENCDSNVNCSGHGVCNNLLHCHCDVGYSPPRCIPSRKSPGGSIDDGFWGTQDKHLPLQRRAVSRKNSYLFGFYIFLPLLVLAVIIVFKWNKTRFWNREGTATEEF
ncbi:A disintegrin and metallopeptidase domain 3 [Ailuropoda melanoleuca]|nr:A disintegrin and metallopeptidase domain 3 [Ailuropoda melanoleuca]